MCVLFCLKFLELCRVTTNNDTVVLDLVRQRYSRTDSLFLGSCDFRLLINTCSSKISADPSNKFVYIRDFVDQLKAHKARPQKRPLHHKNRYSSPDCDPEPKRYKPESAAESSNERSSATSCQLESRNVAGSCESSEKSQQSFEELQDVDVMHAAEVVAAGSPPIVDQSSLQCMKGEGDGDPVLTKQVNETEKKQEGGSAQKEPVSSTNATNYHIRRLEKLLVVRIC